LEHPVDVPPTVFELREDLERLERVDDDQVEATLLLDRANPLSESLEPIFLLAEEVRGRPRIEDDERPLRDLEAEAEGSHLFEEARSAFLEAQVQAVQAGTGRVLEEDRESEGGLHRARVAFAQDRVAPRDPALQRVVEAVDEGADARRSFARGFRGDRSAAPGGPQGRLDGDRFLALAQDVALPLLF